MLGSSEFRKITCGESEGVVKVLTEFPEVTEMTAGSGSDVYRALLGSFVWAGAIINGHGREIQI